MRYAMNEDLPEHLRSVLPVHAQNIYRETYNKAWESSADASTGAGDETREEAADKAAWAAVSRTYEKLDGSQMWGEKDYHRYLDENRGELA